jgi:hypothetical protein
MALSASVVWEIRPSIGSDSNGGGFNPSVSSPGTDYSQQNSAQYTGTDGTAAGTAAFTSVSHSFVAADVGNMINIASGSGFTTGYYTIVSVATGTATLDRSPGTGTVAHYALGGALNGLAFLINGVVAVNGNTFYIKNTGSITLTVFSGGAGMQCAYGRPASFSMIGYGSTRGDSGQATITTATNSCTIFQCDGLGNQSNLACYFTNIIFSNTASSRSAWASQQAAAGGVLIFANCVFDGFTSIINMTVYQLVMINCEVKNNTAHIADCLAYSCLLVGCYFHGNTGTFFLDGGSFAVFTAKDCVFYNNGGAISVTAPLAINSQFVVSVINCAIVSNSGTGISLASAGTNYPQPLYIVNTIIYGNGAFGINVGTSTSPSYSAGANNAMGGNTSGNVSGGYTPPTGTVTLTANPFTNPSGGDFTLNSTAGGGAACKAAGYQSTLI